MILIHRFHSLHDIIFFYTFSIWIINNIIKYSYTIEFCLEFGVRDAKYLFSRRDIREVLSSYYILVVAHAIDTDAELPSVSTRTSVRHPSWDQPLEFPQRTDCNSRGD